jgi:hypothetical protein
MLALAAKRTVENLAVVTGLVFVAHVLPFLITRFRCLFCLETGLPDQS